MFSLAKNLISITEIKILSKKIKIKKIELNKSGGIIKFFYPNNINIIWLTKFLKKKYKTWKIKDKNTLIFKKSFSKNKNKTNLFITNSV